MFDVIGEVISFIRLQIESTTVMPSRTMLEEITEEEIENLLCTLEEQDEPMEVDELAENTSQSKEVVRAILYKLIDQGYVASTPDWKYRITREPDSSTIAAG